MVHVQPDSRVVTGGVVMEHDGEAQLVHIDGEDPRLRATELALRKSIRVTSHDVLQLATSPSASNLQIPLCRMWPMTEVRTPLCPDLEKLKAEFLTGY